MNTPVVCVLRSGGEFAVEHAKRLTAQVRKCTPLCTSFVCLTDLDLKGGASLVKRWPGWFSKLEMFALEGPALYLDLDTTVVGDLSPLLDAAQEHEFIMCRDFWGAQPHGVNSSVMAWCGDARRLYDTFAESPDEYIRSYDAAERWGDQGFIRDHWDGEIALWQEILPGKVASFKRGALMGEDLSDCRVLVSHGQPRPWAPDGADAWLTGQA